jgi:solute carrier family 25 carnitine/acylcarnitine transporter 20/29
MTENNPPAHVIQPPFRGMIAGVFSGMTKLFVGHPFDTLKVRLQTEGSYGRFKGPLDCLLQTFKTEGFKGLYKGATPPLFGWSIMDATMIGTYVMTRNQLEKHTHSDHVPFWHYVLAGGFAGCVRAFIACPVEQVKARLQVQYADPSTKIYNGPIDCIRKLVRNNGVLGLYNGFSGTVLFGSFLSIYFGSYELYNKYLRKNFKGTLSDPARNFLAGGCAANTMWAIAFPADLIKNKMMAQPDVAVREYRSIGECIKKTFAREGLRGFYNGFIPCMLRSFPVNGAALMVTEATLRHLP